MDKKITVAQAKEEFAANKNRIIDESVDGFVVLKNVGKVYNNRVQAVYNFNLSVKKNEFVVLVGPSGCGKSTTLRMIAGLEEITDGKLYIDNVFANYLESKDRDIAMVFQSYALYPNMSVYDNIAFGLQVRGLNKDVIKEKVFHAAEVLDLGQYLDRKPKELSGGQMQRVALGRAIVRDAKLFLMDEPLSNLDAKLRVHMRSEIVKLHKSINATTIYVTHDQTEAMTMADRIVIMNKGVVQQIGAPIEVYNNPANIFVATFIGNPPMNVFKAKLIGNHIVNGDEIEVPAELSQKYSAYIDERKVFFEDLYKKAECVEENSLKTEISSLIKSLKNIGDEELVKACRVISDKLVKLSEEKGFINFTATDSENFIAAITAGGKKEAQKELSACLDILNGTDLTIAGILKGVSSSTMNVQTESVAENKKSKKKEQKISLYDENMQKIREYLEAYSQESAKTDVIIGIRPEDIYFYDTFNGNKSNPIATKADLLELLGSEYCMHSNAFSSELIIKRSAREAVSIGDSITLCFDMDRIKIFDPISGNTVNKK